MTVKPAYPNFRAFAEDVATFTMSWLEGIQEYGATWRSLDGDRHAILSAGDGRTQLRFKGINAPPTVAVDPDERGAADDVAGRIKAYLDRPPAARVTR